MMALLMEMEQYAKENHVPIIRQNEVGRFLQLIEDSKPLRVLEIGTAIGYSTLQIAAAIPGNGQIVTIELAEERYRQAREFINRSPLGCKIRTLQGDASLLIDTLEGPFDFIFLDGPKGQYLRQLQSLLPKLAPQAIIAADNVLFRNMVRGGELVPRRYKTIVQRLRSFISFVEADDRFDMTIWEDGDGLAVIRWKG